LAIILIFFQTQSSPCLLRYRVLGPLQYQIISISTLKSSITRQTFPDISMRQGRVHTLVNDAQMAGFKLRVADYNFYARVIHGADACKGRIILLKDGSIREIGREQEQKRVKRDTGDVEQP
jgi:hypothetical protein